MRSRYLNPLLSLALLAAGLHAAARAQSIPPKDAITKSSPPVLAAFSDVVAKARPSTVRIRCEDKDAALGTVVGADGWILTKASLLSGTATCVLPDGREVPARVVGEKKEFDLAMLKADVTGLKPVEWRESKAVEVGSWVATPGNGPLPVAVGVVSVATRKMPTLGMPRFMPSANSGFLGVLLGPVEDGPGVVVNSVEEKSPADKAGLKAKDVVLSVNGQTVSDVDDLRERLGRHKPGDEVELKVKRGKEELTLKATLGKRPSSANRGDFQNSLGSTLSDRRTGFPVVLQHDQVLKPTDCGGPVVDLDGCAVGVNIARAGRTESYAIPTESVLPLLFDLASGKLTPPTPKGASTAAPASPSPGSAGGTTNTSELPAKPPAAGANPQRVADAEAAVTRARAALAAAEKALAEAEAALKKATQPPK